MDIAKKKVADMTLEELRSVPFRAEWSVPVLCCGLVLCPEDSLHSSGFRHIRVIAHDRDELPICAVTVGSDAIHLDGIGGMGKEWWHGAQPTSFPPKVLVTPTGGWCLDALPTSGALRLYILNDRFQIEVGDALSSLEVFSLKKEAGKE